MASFENQAALKENFKNLQNNTKSREQRVNGNRFQSIEGRSQMNLNQTYDESAGILRENLKLPELNTLNQSYDEQSNPPMLSTLSRSNNYLLLKQQQDMQSQRGRSLGQRNLRNKVTYLSVFPMYGLWDGKTTFKSQKEIDHQYAKDKNIIKNQNNGNGVDKSHFRKLYFEKVYMEELLKMKNIMNNKK